MKIKFQLVHGKTRHLLSMLAIKQCPTGTLATTSITYLNHCLNCCSCCIVGNVGVTFERVEERAE